MGVGGNGVRELVGGREKWGGGKRGAPSWGAGGGKGSPDAKVTSGVKSSEPPG